MLLPTIYISNNMRNNIICIARENLRNVNIRLLTAQADNSISLCGVASSSNVILYYYYCYSKTANFDIKKL